MITTSARDRTSSPAASPPLRSFGPSPGLIFAENTILPNEPEKLLKTNDRSEKYGALSPALTRVNRLLEVPQQPQRLFIHEREELHHHHRAQRPFRVDPVERVLHPRPRQTPRRPSARVPRLVDQEPVREPVRHARVEIHVARNRRP